MSIIENDIKNSKANDIEDEKFTFLKLMSCYMYAVQQVIFNPNHKYASFLIYPIGLYLFLN